MFLDEAFITVTLPLRPAFAASLEFDILYLSQVFLNFFVDPLAFQ